MQLLQASIKQFNLPYLKVSHPKPVFQMTLRLR